MLFPSYVNNAFRSAFAFAEMLDMNDRWPEALRSTLLPPRVARVIARAFDGLWDGLTPADPTFGARPNSPSFAQANA